MARAVPIGDQSCVGELVEAALLEADREGPDWLRALGGRERGQGRRVDAAGEEDADRHIRNEVGPHGVAESSAQLLDQLGLVLEANLVRRDRCRPGKARELEPAVLPGEDMSRWELPDLAKDRQGRRDAVEGEEAFDGIEVDLAPRKRPQLGRERELAVCLPVIERLDPEAVSG